MGAETKIEWCHHTFNGWRGCTKVSDGCKNCYAEKMSHRNPKVLGEWGPGAKRVLAVDSYWRQPLKWNRDAERDGVRRRVFCASLADVFDAEVPIEWFMRLVNLIRATPHLDWLLLTKRPENIEARFTAVRHPADNDLPIYDCLPEYLPNLWLGVSVENQRAADERIPILLQIPVAVRFLSCEPLLGPVRLDVCAPHILDGDESNPGIVNAFSGMAYHPATVMFAPSPEGTAAGIQWVIVGGESGPHARPMHPQWARDLRNQCNAAGVAFHFKQWGEWTPGENVERTSGKVTVAHLFGGQWALSEESLASSDGHCDDEPDVYRVGKKAVGRLLDGREWNEFPAEVR